MTGQDVGWRMILASWVESHVDDDRDLMRMLCDTYIETAMTHLRLVVLSIVPQLMLLHSKGILKIVYVDFLFYRESTLPAMFDKPGVTAGRYKRLIWQSEENMISTLTTIVDVRIITYLHIH